MELAIGIIFLRKMKYVNIDQPTDSIMIQEPHGKITMTGFTIEDAEHWRLHDPVVDKNLRYFEAQTGGKRLPRRKDLNPEDITQILPEVALFEPVYDEAGSLVDVKIQLLGTKLDNFYGSVTGTHISDFPSPLVSERVLQACKHCISVSKPVVVSADALSDKKNHLAITALYVPMSDDGVLIDRIFLHNQIRSKLPR